MNDSTPATDRTVKVTFIEPDGKERTVDARIGATLMNTAVNNGIRGILAECGGSCTCATCHVYVDSRWIQAVGKPEATEHEMLTIAIDPQPDSRLSCQVTITEALDGLIVRVPSSQF
jgi:2Fe-2S ferredoxin